MIVYQLIRHSNALFLEKVLEVVWLLSTNVQNYGCKCAELSCIYVKNYAHKCAE